MTMEANVGVLISELLKRVSALEEMLKTNIKLNCYDNINNKEIINIDECAILTNIKKNQLYKLTSTGGIPYFKVGKHLRFDKANIINWLRGHDN